jgi:16S rRNA (uracil1498-N3)-methyltransferase
MPYFFAHRDGDRVEIIGTDARHLSRSLRARPGELVSVVEPEGRLLTVRLETVGPERVTGWVEAEVEHRPEPARPVTLAIAMLPAAALELTFSRCTEAGAAGFLLVEAERSVARRGASGPTRTARAQRWATICREAAMLAGRLIVPAVTGPIPFADAWAGAEQPLLLDRGGLPWTLGRAPEEAGCTLFIGPEGGWSPAERARAGERVVSLGARNLRADTAALVATAVAVHCG